MLSDLLTLRKEILTASAGQEQSQKAETFRAQVVAEISSLFDDPKYPQRRRSFGAIRKRLGVFDPDDPELKDILFAMGARVFQGEGEEALWELAAQTQSAPMAEPKAKKALFARLSLWLIVAAIALVVCNTLLGTLFGVSLLEMIQSLGAAPQTHEACLEAANGILLEIMKCNSEHG